jgi:putative transposase
MIQKDHQLPKPRRCELLEKPRSSSYYQVRTIFEPDQKLMRLSDTIHLKKPFLGSRRIVDALAKINPKTPL